MAHLDLDATLRWFRFDPRRSLQRRPDSALPFLTTSVESGQGLLLDTCVYIDQLRGRLPDHALRFLDLRTIHHSTVAIQELLFGVGFLDSVDRRTARTSASVHAVIRAMRPHRTFAPDPDLLGRAALLAGLLARTQSYSGDSRRRAAMDAILFLQAQKLGLMVLTRNIGDFDLMLQLLPSARVMLYRGELAPG